MNTDFSTIQKLFVENAFSLTQEQYDAFTIYSTFLVEYNQKVNLTAITEPEEIWKKQSSLKKELLWLYARNLR